MHTIRACPTALGNEAFAMSQSRTMTGRAGWQEKRYPRGRVLEEANRPFMAPRRAGQLGLTARAVQLTNGRPVCLCCTHAACCMSTTKGETAQSDESLLRITGTNWAFTKTVTARMPRNIEKRFHIERINNYTHIECHRPKSRNLISTQCCNTQYEYNY